MDMWTMVFLIIGVIIIVVSFMIPTGKEEKIDATDALARREIEDLVSLEMGSIKTHVDEVLEEAIEYAMEKTERSLERLSNEKIMAVSEYSDTVLKEIHRNHEEVMFLYDMLNDKHKNLKNTVTEVNKTMKEAKEAEAEISFKKFVPESIVVKEDAVSQEAVTDTTEETETVQQREEDNNRNEEILKLHKQGASAVEIAQQLELGVGEVKLVIDLFQGV